MIDLLSSYVSLCVFCLEYDDYEELEGEQINELKNGGYRPFVNYLKSFIPNDNRIRLNCEVTRMKFNKEDQKLLLEMTHLNEHQTTTIICNHIIWTTSLSYLKKNFHTIFAHELKLIQQKQTAIANIGFSTVNKVKYHTIRNFESIKICNNENLSILIHRINNDG